MKDHRNVVLVLLLCLVADSKSEFPEPGPVCNDTNQKLMNTVVSEGDSISFSNQPDPNGVKWEFIPSVSPDISMSPFTIADNSTVQPPFVGDYIVNSTHLNIPAVIGISKDNSKPYSTSGLYTLTYKTDGCQSMANLIDVSYGPSCDCSDTASELTCSLSYSVNRKYANQAKMIWTTDCGQAYSGTVRIGEDGSLDIATSSLPVKSSDAARFTCTVTFDAPHPSGPANMATNVVSFNKTCTIDNCVKNGTVIEERPSKGNNP